MTAAEFCSKVPEFQPRLWTRKGKCRVYLTPPGRQVDAGYVDFTGGAPLLLFRMDASDAAKIREALHE